MAFDLGATEPTAKGMFNFALDYFGAAKLLLESRGKAIALQSPLYYLISHAFELFSKSFLMSHGLNYRDLKALNHGIKGILEKCKELGLPVDPDDVLFSEVMINLNKHNMQRYPMLGLFQIGPIGFSEPENLITHLDKFKNKVGFHIGVKNAAN